METAMTVPRHRPKLPPRLDFIPSAWGFIHILRHGMRAGPFAGDMPQSAGGMRIRTESPDHLVQPNPTIHSIPPQGVGRPSHAARGDAPLHRFIRRQALRRPSHSLSRCVLVRSSKMGCRKTGIRPLGMPFTLFRIFNVSPIHACALVRISGLPRTPYTDTAAGQGAADGRPFP